MRRTFGSRTFDLARQVVVLAIVNRTPDSFYDRGRTFAIGAALERVEAALADGADWIDVGGVKAAPGAPVDRAEELRRVLPLVEAARALTSAVISVDTFDPEVARQALAAGADVVNDSSGLHDPAVADAVAEAGAGLILMHNVGRPRTPAFRPAYDDVVAEVGAFLTARAAAAERRGVGRERIVIDPGHDFHKNTWHSLALTRRLGELTGLGYPVLVALSNKDFVGETLAVGVDERLEGSLAALVACVLAGARLVRVHDVRASVRAARMTEAIMGLRPPAAPRRGLA